MHADLGGGDPSGPIRDRLDLRGGCSVPCEHFVREVPATLTGEQGTIESPFSPCRSGAAWDRLHLSIDPNDARENSSAERMVIDRPARIARREDLLVKWARREQRSDAGVE